MLHLDHWYAQSHPDEDFAETFAVWLDPESNWGMRYAGWPVLRKLEYMDRLMRGIGARRPRVSSRRRVDPLSRLKKTLGEHYRRKREHYGLDRPYFYDSDLRKLFSDSPQYAKNLPAARFVRRIRRHARMIVASFTDSYQYTIDQLLENIIERCRELNLRLTESEDATRTDIDFLCEVVQAAIEAGATTINIPDTVGYTVPSEFSRIIAKAVGENVGLGVERAPSRAEAWESYLERTPVEDMEREKLLLLLNRNEWNIARVARLMGVTRRTIYLRLQRYNIPRERVPKTRPRRATA